MSAPDSTPATPASAAPTLGASGEFVASSPARFADYLELTKPRLSMLSVITAIVGYFVARAPWDGPLFFFTLLGTSLCAGGVAALNQWMESDTDALMRRTAGRPIPSGKIPSGSAFVLGWACSLVGLGLLFAKVNGYAALFSLATIVSYLALYTPAKRWSRWSTEIGAVAGAFPPLIGWAAAGCLDASLGWILFGILFFWQIPHFMAIAWTYRQDYSAAHFPMLAVRDTDGTRVARWSLINTFAVVAVSALPSFLHLTGKIYLGVTAVLGLWFIARALVFLRKNSRETAARKLFFASIIWLPLQLAALVIDRVLAH